MKGRHAGLVAGAILALAFAASAGASGNEGLVVARYARVADKPFEDVVLDLQFIISRHNFALTGRHRLGHAIRARGVDPNHPDAMVVNFCNVAYARRAIAIDPALMVYMPCKVALLQRPSGVLVQTLLLPSTTGRPAFDRFAGELNTILRDIVDYAATGN